MPKYYLEHYGFVGDDENYLMHYGVTAYTSQGHHNNNGGRYDVQSSVSYNRSRGKNKKRR